MLGDLTMFDVNKSERQGKDIILTYLAHRSKEGHD